MRGGKTTALKARYRKKVFRKSEDKKRQMEFLFVILKYPPR